MSDVSTGASTAEKPPTWSDKVKNAVDDAESVYDAGKALVEHVVEQLRAAITHEHANNVVAQLAQDLHEAKEDICESLSDKAGEDAGSSVSSSTSSSGSSGSAGSSGSSSSSSSGSAGSSISGGYSSSTAE